MVLWKLLLKLDVVGGEDTNGTVERRSLPPFLTDELDGGDGFSLSERCIFVSEWTTQKRRD